MKKIILLAIMLGLVGCGEKGSSDVTSTTNNQSTELTSNNIQQASARSISTYSMTVPFDGWHLFNPKALGASALYEGTKDALTSSAVLTADASQVAKVLGKGVAGYALSVAVEELLGAVNWVLDPTNNTVKYYVNIRPDLAQPYDQYYVINYADNKKYATNDGACQALLLVHKNHSKATLSYSSSAWRCKLEGSGVKDIHYTLKTYANPAYDPNAEREQKNLHLETVAQKVIENADAGSLDAQIATMAAAAQILEDAANDEEIEQEIVDQLENKSQCPSGIVRNGSCWVCDRSQFMPITRATRDAKTAARGKSCEYVTDPVIKATNAVFWRNLINARIQENACWSPVDPNHLIELNNNRNALSRCEN
ncbi:hypothetical protein [Acinetobacter sp. ANC 4173]|uniref:hypothetical protein n=1 Tax=Acinetobacter sp. ANC 4173 TaxID=2529837 RepID=UPI00103EA0B9|nr:hypothetical protein [Acinetobacter sp. ANC 4173]TCB74165.1 hypothetical protein E0H94_17655 [Acinetobacter sp. ANC 4173]